MSDLGASGEQIQNQDLGVPTQEKQLNFLALMFMIQGVGVAWDLDLHHFSRMVKGVMWQKGWLN